MKRLILIYILLFLIKTIPNTNDIEINTNISQSTNIVGNLTITNLIDIPLVQSSNNEYYLTHNINNEYDIKGTEFIDYRNTPTDKQINIYGHNSITKKVPFQNLQKLLNKENFNKDIYINLEFNKIKREYQLVAITKTDTNDHIKINNKENKKQINKLLKNSIYKKDITYDNNTNIIVIQTCILNTDTYYLIIGFETNSSYIY